MGGNGYFQQAAAAAAVKTLDRLFVGSIEEPQDESVSQLWQWPGGGGARPGQETTCELRVYALSEKLSVEK